MRDLAERLQDIFDIVYEDNQPFATREECVKDLEYHLINDDEFINVLIDNLKMIRNEYSLGIDGKAMDLINELENIKIQKKFRKIAMFILGHCDMSTILDYDDDTHIQIINEALDNTPKELLRYLEDAAYNNRHHMEKS